MPQPPQLLPTQVEYGAGPGLSHRIDGDLVPVFHLRLDGSMRVNFEHHVILWKDTWCRGRSLPSDAQARLALEVGASDALRRRRHRSRHEYPRPAQT